MYRVLPSVWENTSERSRLDLLLFFSEMESVMLGLIGSSGKRAQPLKSVKTKILAMSLLKDNFEQLDEESVWESYHSNFSNKI